MAVSQKLWQRRSLSRKLYKLEAYKEKICYFLFQNTNVKKIILLRKKLCQKRQYHQNHREAILKVLVVVRMTCVAEFRNSDSMCKVCLIIIVITSNPMFLLALMLSLSYIIISFKRIFHIKLALES